MPRSKRADGHDAETIGALQLAPNLPGSCFSTKIRAETRKIVGCVAKYFEEVEQLTQKHKVVARKFLEMER
ncbi:hypothetical protein JG688_00000496 [Phytophthora aleatoria]|uniref:Uncharacterized protein n=1 Tax=Phytophthora aleatoria TaxID=2496075 RepID=A0A8J5JHF4_9STRA|nr:hypothetical protein JG688_00000496 [Phytophthora aleatoria]